MEIRQKATNYSNVVLPNYYREKTLYVTADFFGRNTDILAKLFDFLEMLLGNKENHIKV